VSDPFTHDDVSFVATSHNKLRLAKTVIAAFVTRDGIVYT